MTSKELVEKILTKRHKRYIEAQRETERVLETFKNYIQDEANDLIELGDDIQKIMDESYKEMAKEFYKADDKG
jgi:phosphotransacetylase